MEITTPEPPLLPSDLSPEWERRVRPDFQLSGMSMDGRSYTEAMQPLQDTPEAWEYVDAINAVRVPLQERLRTNTAPALLRIVYLPKIIDTVSQVTGTPPFPQNRVVMSRDIERTTEYQRAVDHGFTLPLDGPTIARYDPLLGIVQIHSDHFDELNPRRSPVEVMDAVANSLGRAAIGDIIDVSLDRQAGEFRAWNGLVWRPGNNDKYYGELLEDAVVTHIAALVRHELRLVDIPRQKTVRDHVEPVTDALALYRRPEGYTPADFIAAGVRILGENAGRPDGPGVDLHQLLAAFAISGRTSAARVAPVEAIRRAAAFEPSLRLEALEALRPLPGMPLGILHRIEEASGLAPDSRPSHPFA